MADHDRLASGDDLRTAFWEERYGKEGHVWGDEPSRTVEQALAAFKQHDVRDVLVAGSGYGRNSRPFSSAGMSVTGFEISVQACQMARQFAPELIVYQGSALDLSVLSVSFDAIYAFNLLHLFTEDERRLLLRQFWSKLCEGGLLYCSVFSEQEPSYGSGFRSEPNTFESRPGRPTHYFDHVDLMEHLKDWRILETGLIDDPENHGSGPHVHRLRYALAQKGSN